MLSRRSASEACVNIVPALSKRAQATLKRGRRESRVSDAPAASRGVKNTRVSHHRFTGKIRLSPRNGFNGFLRALPSDRAFLPLSPAQCAGDITSVRCEASSLVMRRHCRQLDASVGASGPHDFAVRERVRFVLRTAASIASHRNVRDDREPPLIRGETAELKP
jgi:hypothetical protein